MAETTGARPAKRKFFWRTVGRAYASVFGNLGVLLRIARRWILPIFALQAAYSWWLQPHYVALSQAMDAGAPVPKDLAASIGGLLIWLVLVVPMSAIAVGWHRYLIRDEAPTASAGGIGGPVGAYVVMAIVLGLISYAAVFVLEFAPTPRDDEFPALLLIGSIGIWVALAVTSRLSLALPAIAVDGPGQTFGQAWAATRRHTFRMLWGVLICTLPCIVAGWLIFVAADQLPDRLMFALAAGVLGIVSTLLITVMVSFLSFAYRHFQLDGPGTTTDESGATAG